MTRSSFVTTVALLLAGGLSTAFAQHAGSGHSSAPSGHASAPHTSFSSPSVHSHSAPATTYSTLSNHYPTPGQAVYPTPLGLQHTYSGYTGINTGVLSNRPYGYGLGNRPGLGNRYPYRGGYVYPYFPYYISTFDDSDPAYSGGYNNYVEDPGEQTANVNANLLGEQIAQLSAEVDALRNDREGQYPPPVRPPYNAPPPVAEDETPSAPPLELVLNDGKTVEMKNYAVSGDYIWDFSTTPTKKIAIASININASKAASEAKGAEFPDLH